ncbi:CopG family ribbon-helix-helix protein [Bradyrhizobium diazoefficiens]|uniref:CopG family ribbon-helix-helix protein n=1 Tax=Bradyrhizobium diazoefficiens TaxID=1355477 RepID=UPI00359534EA
MPSDKRPPRGSEGTKSERLIRERIPEERLVRREEPPRRDVELRREVDHAIQETKPRPFRTVDNRVIDDRPRVTTNLDPEMKDALDRIALDQRRTKSDIVREAIEKIVVEAQEKPVTPTNDRVVIQSPQEVILYSTMMIAALEETLEYSAERHHNHPPPALLIEDKDYLDEIRRLVAELKRLNENLEMATKEPKKPKRTPKEVQKSAVDVKKHLNTFLDKYAQSLGRGAAALTIGTASALLIRFGVPPETFSAILKNLKP